MQLWKAISNKYGVDYFVECNSGTYGKNCASNCSSNCLDGMVCMNSNGKCLRGCKPGFIGDTCDRGK